MCQYQDIWIGQTKVRNERNFQVLSRVTKLTLGLFFLYVRLWRAANDPAFSLVVSVSVCGLRGPGLKVKKLEFILKLKVKRNDWLLADMCPQAVNQCALF